MRGIRVSIRIRIMIIFTKGGKTSPARWAYPFYPHFSAGQDKNLDLKSVVSASFPRPALTSLWSGPMF